MKLLIILSIAEFADEVRQLMARNKVPVYSETEMHGFRTERYQPDVRSWFSQSDYGVYSTLFFSFQEEATVARILEEVREYNRKWEKTRDNPLHAFQVPVEAYA